MSLGNDFIAFLKTKQAVTDLIGPRITQDDADPHWKQYVTFRRNDRMEELDLAGEGGVAETQYEVQCVGESRVQADAIAGALHDALNGFRGAWGATPIMGVFVNSQNDDYAHTPDGSELTRNQTELIVRIFSRE